MFIIGINPYQGLFTKAQFKQGKGDNPGTRASVVGANGQTNEFVAVKLGVSTWVNGTVVRIDGTSVGGISVTASSGASTLLNGRIGVLVFSSATATQTSIGTVFGWAQIYGQCLALVSASVTLPGIQLQLGQAGELMQAVVQGTATSQLKGITAIGTNTAASTLGLLTVMLQYPAFAGLPDGNLA